MKRKCCRQVWVGGSLEGGDHTQSTGKDGENVDREATSTVALRSIWRR